jgi:hypothetical protein
VNDLRARALIVDEASLNYLAVILDLRFGRQGDSSPVIRTYRAAAQSVEFYLQVTIVDGEADSESWCTSFQ